jgi:hypothetical protein
LLVVNLHTRWSSLRSNLTDPVTGFCPLLPDYQDLSQVRKDGTVKYVAGVVVATRPSWLVFNAVGFAEFHQREFPTPLGDVAVFWSLLALCDSVLVARGFMLLFFIIFMMVIIIVVFHDHHRLLVLVLGLALPLAVFDAAHRAGGLLARRLVREPTITAQPFAPARGALVEVVVVVWGRRWWWC